LFYLPRTSETANQVREKSFHILGRLGTSFEEFAAKFPGHLHPLFSGDFALELLISLVANQHEYWFLALNPQHGLPKDFQALEGRP